jgi:YVTN family beta-propeller protein
MTTHPKSGARFGRMKAIAAVAVGALIVVGIPFAASAQDTDFSTISVGDEPAAVVFTPDGLRAYVSNYLSDTVSVIDTVTNTVSTTIPVSGGPYGLAMSPDGLSAYVTRYDDGLVSVIDTATNTVSATSVDVGALSHPFGIAITPDGSTLYVGTYGLNTTAVLSTAPFAAVTTVSTASYPQAVAVSPDGSEAWVGVTNNGNGHFSVINTADNSVTDFPLPAGSWPAAVAFSPDGSKVLVGDSSLNVTYVIDAASRTVDYTVTHSSAHLGVAVSPDGLTGYIAFGSYGASDPAKRGVLPFNLATGVTAPEVPTEQYTRAIAIAPNGSFGLAVNGQASSVTSFGEPVRRVSGSSRYETAIGVSQQGFPGGARVVLVATGQNYPDALAAGPAAAELDAPLLLTDPDSLPTAVRNEIIRLNPTEIIVVGGEGAVSAGVFNALVPLATTVTRIAGTDRYDTARKITTTVFGAGGAPEAYIATGLNFPDALSAGAVGAALGRPVLLVDGGASSVDSATMSTLSYLGTSTVIIAGGTGAVSSGIQTQLSGTLTATRESGTTRYDTSLAINAAGYTGSATRVLIATGVNFPDALAGSAWAGQLKAPLFIVPGTCVPQNMLDKITSLGAVQVSLIGGTGVLTQSVFDLTAC